MFGRRANGLFQVHMYVFFNVSYLDYEIALHLKIILDEKYETLAAPN